MSRRKRKILSYVGLGFMAIFSVALILFYFNQNMWNGGIAFIALFSGTCGIAILFYIKQLAKKDTSYLPEEEENTGDNIEDGVAEYEDTQSKENDASGGTDKPE